MKSISLHDEGYRRRCRKVAAAIAASLHSSMPANISSRPRNIICPSSDGSSANHLSPYRRNFTSPISLLLSQNRCWIAEIIPNSVQLEKTMNWWITSKTWNMAPRPAWRACCPERRPAQLMILQPDHFEGSMSGMSFSHPFSWLLH